MGPRDLLSSCPHTSTCSSVFSQPQEALGLAAATFLRRRLVFPLSFLSRQPRWGGETYRAHTFWKSAALMSSHRFINLILSLYPGSLAASMATSSLGTLGTQRIINHRDWGGATSSPTGSGQVPQWPHCTATPVGGWRRDREDRSLCPWPRGHCCSRVPGLVLQETPAGPQMAPCREVQAGEGTQVVGARWRQHPVPGTRQGFSTVGICSVRWERALQAEAPA